MSSNTHNNPLEFDTNDITSIVPEYDFAERGEGRFRVEVGHKQEACFTIRFGSFLDHRLTVDQEKGDGELFVFMMNNYSDKTVSHVIDDLYDIGFPVDEWVIEYIQDLLNKSTKYAAMLKLFTTLLNFDE
jgi:hypothetical protein